MSIIWVVTIGIIVWSLFIFRRVIFYSKHTPADRPKNNHNQDQDLNLYGIVENLLHLPQVRKLRLSHDMLNNIYLSHLPDNEIIWIKKSKNYNPLFRFFLQLNFHGFEWFLKGQRIEVYIDTLNNCSSSELLSYENRMVVKIGSMKDKNQELNLKLSKTLLKYLKTKLNNKDLRELPSTEREEVLTKTLKTAVHFVRGVGYIHYRHLILPKVNWDDPELFSMMEAVGSKLDPEVFKIRLRLVNIELIASLHSDQFWDKNFIVIEYRSDPMSRVQATARNQIALVKSRFRSAKELAKEKLSIFNNHLNEFQHLASVTGYSVPNPEELETYNTSEEIQAQERLIAKIFTKFLTKRGRKPIKDSVWNSSVLVADRFIKRSNKNILGEEYDKLLNQVIASKLGVTVDILKSNNGFQEFAYKSHLHRYMAVYQHELEVVPNTNEIKILFKGTMCYWKDIKDKLNIDPDSKQFLGHYSEPGLIDRGLTDWTELVPFKHEPKLPPPWGNRYICEICSWIIDAPRINGDHSFLRFKTPQGEWYSIGQYMPQKHNARDQLIFPMRVKQCRFMCPDISEYWEGPITIIQFEISRTQFLEIKKKLEDDQSKKEHLYQFLHDNCTIYAKSVLEIAGIQLPSSMSLSDLLFPNLSRWGRALHRMKWTPKWIRPLIRLSWTMMVNCILLVFGSGVVDRQLRQSTKIKGVVPFVGSWKDFTDPRKAISEHPFIIGHFVRKQIEEWREARTNVLKIKKVSLEKKLTQFNREERDQSIESNTNARPSIYINLPSQEEIQLRRHLKMVDKALEDVQYAIPSRYLRKNRLTSMQSPILSPLVTPINFDEQFNFDQDNFTLNPSSISPKELLDTKMTKIHLNSP